MSEEVPPKQGASPEPNPPKKIPIEGLSERVQPKQDAPQEQETPTESVSEGVSSRQDAPQEQNQDELAAIRGELGEWQTYCSQWASAYHSAAQRTISWNTKLVIVGIGLAAITSALSALGGTTSAWVGYVGAGVGVATAIATGLQKSAFASPEQAKQYRSAAIAYESTKRDIGSALTSFLVADLRTQLDTVKTHLNATDAQAPELPEEHHPSPG